MKTCRTILGLIFLLATGVLMDGCRKKPGESPAARDLPAASVRVQTVESRSRPAMDEVVGTVRAKLRASIEAKTSGRIEKVFVTLGQSVKAGDLLVQLDAREIQARLDQAIAVREPAEIDLKRVTTLLKQGTVTQAEFDVAQARQRVAQAGVAEAETFLSHAKVVAPFDGVITQARRRRRPRFAGPDAA